MKIKTTMRKEKMTSMIDEEIDNDEEVDNDEGEKDDDDEENNFEEREDENGEEL